MLAQEQVSSVKSIVADKVDTVFEWAATARNAALTALANIGTFPVPVMTLNAPAPPKLGNPAKGGGGGGEDGAIYFPGGGGGGGFHGEVNVTPVQVTYQQTPQVTFTTPPELPSLEYGVAVAPPTAPTEGVSSPPTLYPQAPIPAVPNQPVISDPAEPTLVNASPPGFLPIDVPSFTFPVLPAFDAPFPVYDVPKPIEPIKPILTYPPPTTELRDRILTLLEGGDLTGVQEAMIDKLVEGTDVEAQKLIDTAFSAAAGKNFSLPYGVLVDGVNDIRVAAGQKIRDGMSDINNKIAQEALKNYQAGMELALVLEKAYVSYYLEYARQILEVEKLNVEIAIEFFNATVALFNAQQQARQIHAGAWKAQVAGIISGMDSYPTAIEGAIAETAENEQRVQMYAADGGLVKAQSQVYTATTKKQMAPIEMYKAEVGGVKAQADIVAANVDAYRAAVTAYATGVAATVEVVNAYAIETQAKATQVSVYTANAKAYSQYVREGTQRANTWKVFANAQGDVLRANVQSFQAAAEVNQAFVRAQAAEVSAQAQLASALVASFGAEIQAAKAHNRAMIDNFAAVQQSTMVTAENVSRAMALAAIAQAETDRVNAGALAAEAQALAGLAQGSMSAMHVSQGAEGSGTMGASANWSSGASQSVGGSNTYSEAHNSTLSA